MTAMEEPRPGKRSVEEINAALNAEIRYEGLRSLSRDEMETIEEAKTYVADFLRRSGFTDALHKIDEIGPDKVRVFGKRYGFSEGAWFERRAEARRRTDGILEFRESTVQGPAFLHIAVHEIYHDVSHTEHQYVDLADGDYIRASVGLRRYPIGRELDDVEKRDRFSGLNEAVTETLTRLTMPHDSEDARRWIYPAERYMLHIILRKMVEARSLTNPSFSLADAWHVFLDDYLSGTHTFLKVLEGAYPPQQLRRLGKFGNDRDMDLDLLEEFHPAKWEGFGMDVVQMAWGGDTQAAKEFAVWEAELRDAVSSKDR